MSEPATMTSDSPVQTYAGGDAAGHASAPPRHRLVAATVLAATLGLLLVAASLDPSPAGYGTHESLGLPPCGLKSMSGLPCATCGMTTAFSHAANGQLLAAFSVQPIGTLLALFTAMTAIVAALALVFDFSLAPFGRMLGQKRTLMVLATLVIAGWIYTIWLSVGG